MLEQSAGLETMLRCAHFATCLACAVAALIRRRADDWCEKVPHHNHHNFFNNKKWNMAIKMVDDPSTFFFKHGSGVFFGETGVSVRKAFVPPFALRLAFLSLVPRCCFIVVLLFFFHWGQQKQIKASSKDAKVLGLQEAKEQTVLKAKQEKLAKEMAVARIKKIEGTFSLFPWPRNAGEYASFFSLAMEITRAFDSVCCDTSRSFRLPVSFSCSFKSSMLSSRSKNAVGKHCALCVSPNELRCVF